MGVDYEIIEKTWIKPKKTVLDELEEWLKSEGFIMQDEYGYLITEPTDDNKVIYIEDILDKIQELKKGERK